MYPWIEVDYQAVIDVSSCDAWAVHRGRFRCIHVKICRRRQASMEQTAEPRERWA